MAPSGPIRSKKFQTTLILAFEANSALSSENEIKIVKIIHSEKKGAGCWYVAEQFPQIEKMQFSMSGGWPDNLAVKIGVHTPNCLVL